MTGKLQTREQMLAGMTTSEQQAVPVAPLKLLELCTRVERFAWLRDGTGDMDSTPHLLAHAVRATLAAPLPLPCKSGEGAGGVDAGVVTPAISDATQTREATFAIGDRVQKTKGSSWRGIVVGTYSTSLTSEGYAVESENEPGSVQIYPVAALSARDAA